MLRRNREGVASSVATLFSLIVLLLFIQLAVLEPIPRQTYDAEWQTSHEALEAFGQFRSFLAGPAAPGSTFSVAIPLGTFPVSPMAGGSPGALTLDTTVAGPSVSFQFVPNFYQASLKKTDQDIILLIDSSGSMVMNDPLDLRKSGAKEYISKLVKPDRVAIVDFDDNAAFTWANVGGAVHHLYAFGHNGNPDYSEPQSDINTIDSNGGTNFGDAIKIANDEFVANGDKKHVWVMILLTDGENNFAWEDTEAINEANRAKALGVIIYTIGLGPGVNPVILTQIATITGGTYYFAPNASSLRWIYLELSRRYQSSFSCGTYTAGDASVGSVTLSLATRQYPSQVVRFEAGGIAVVQRDGSTLNEGTPFVFQSTGKGSGTLSLTVPTFIGPTATTSGMDYEILQGRIVSRDIVDQPVTRLNLTQESQLITSIATNVQYWTDQGAATQAAANLVKSPLNNASTFVTSAQTEANAGRFANAKFNIDKAQGQLTDAIAKALQQAVQKKMQNWLANRTKDDSLLAGCRLDQWKNWYNGITFSMTTTAAAGWARWYNTTFSRMGALVDVGVAGNNVVVTLHQIDRFTVDRRIVELTFGGERRR